MGTGRGFRYAILSHEEAKAVESQSKDVCSDKQFFKKNAIKYCYSFNIQKSVNITDPLPFMQSSIGAPKHLVPVAYWST